MIRSEPRLRFRHARSRPRLRFAAATIGSVNSRLAPGVDVQTDRGRASEETRTFQVVASVLGPYLPQRAIREFDDVVIAPFSESALLALRGARGVIGSVTDDNTPQLYSVRAPYMQVTSKWGLWISAVARSANEGQEWVESQVLPDLIAALHTLGGAPYRVEIVKVLDPNHPESERVTPLQPTGVFGYVWVDPLTSRRRDAFRRRRQAIGSDQTGAAAAQHLRDAVALGDTPDRTGAAAAAAVLRYYLCVERIVQEVARGARMTGRRAFERRRAEAGTRLAREIATQSGSRAAAAIESATRELRAIDLRLADLELSAAAVVLRLEPEIVDEAKKLYAFRSKHLAHSGLPDAHGVAAWTAGPENRAFRVAAIFLGAYLDYVSNSD